MTLSPPANVKTPGLGPDEPARVLAYGFDSLVLALDVRWEDRHAFELFTELKAKSKVENEPLPGIVRPGDGTSPWLFSVQPHGAGGYEWLIAGSDMAMRIGSWMEPGSRPSVMVDFRSEALWMHGPRTMVERMVNLLRVMGGKVESIKVSRADQTVDVLVREEIWNLGLLDHFVTKALTIHPHLRRNKVLEGITIGAGALMLKLYDKPLEIRLKSHKDWFYDIWGIEAVPPGCRVIRVEFQARREAVKGLFDGTFDGLEPSAEALWAYYTRKWFHVQDDPSLHHTQQRPEPWWHVVQGGYGNSLRVHPAIRAKAIRSNLKQAAQQLLGHITAITALQREGDLIGANETLDLESHLKAIADTVKEAGWNDRKFTEKVKRSQVKKMRAEENYKAAKKLRDAQEGTKDEKGKQ